MLQKRLKFAAAKEAMKYVEDGMSIGLGSGSTSNEFVKLLALEIKKGLNVKLLSSSKSTDLLCQSLGLKLENQLYRLDLAVDGADQITYNLEAIKGGGGALLREKINFFISKKNIVIADESKLCDCLGAFPLPIEINIYAADIIKKSCERFFYKIGYKDIVIDWRLSQNGRKYVTDNCNFILDAHLKNIENPKELNCLLYEIPGLLEHGIFVNNISTAIIAMSNSNILKL